MTTATGFGPLPDLVMEASGPRGVRRVFQQAGLPARLVEERALRLPLGAMVRLFEEGGRVTGDRLLGWRVGCLMDPYDYGMWMRYSLSAPTLRAAIRRLAWSMPLHQSGPAVSLPAHDGTRALAYLMPRLDGVDPALHADHVIPSMLKIARLYLGPDWQPDWIGVPYAEDGGTRTLVGAIGIPLRFDREAILMPLTEDELAARHRSARGVSGTPTRSDVLSRLRAIETGTAGLVEDCIRLELLSGRIGVDGVARRMDVSTRSLQRALAAEGTSFCHLLEKVRREKAIDMLRHSDASVSEVAAALGYSDPSNFGRSFRRWTGSPPSALRRAGERN